MYACKRENISKLVSSGKLSEPFNKIFNNLHYSHRVDSLARLVALRHHDERFVVCSPGGAASTLLH